MEIIDPTTGDAVRVSDKTKTDSRQTGAMMSFFEDYNLEGEVYGKLQTRHVTKSELTTLASKAKTGDLKKELARYLSERSENEKPLIAYVVKKGKAAQDGAKTFVFQSVDGKLADMPMEMNAAIDKVIWWNAEFSVPFSKFLEDRINPDIVVEIAKYRNRWEIRSIRPVAPSSSR